MKKERRIGWLEAAGELERSYDESIFTPLEKQEMDKIAHALAECGVNAASDRLMAWWARHWAENLRIEVVRAMRRRE